MRTRIIFIAFFIILLLASLWFGLKPHISSFSGADIASPKIQSATVFNSNKAIEPFSLNATTDRKFTERSLLGHWTVLFFGYTDCPDICPRTLKTLQNIWQQFAAKNTVAARFVFTSINPEQDDINKLRDFLAEYDEDFIGITGTPAEVAIFSQQLGIFANEQSNVNGKKLIDHSASLLLINPRGHLAAVFSPPFDVTAIAQDLLLLTAP